MIEKKTNRKLFYIIPTKEKKFGDRLIVYVTESRRIKFHREKKIQTKKVAKKTVAEKKEHYFTAHFHFVDSITWKYIFFE